MENKQKKYKKYGKFLRERPDTRRGSWDGLSFTARTFGEFARQLAWYPSSYGNGEASCLMFEENYVRENMEVVARGEMFGTVAIVDDDCCEAIRRVLNEAGEYYIVLDSNDNYHPSFTILRHKKENEQATQEAQNDGKIS